MDSRGVSRDGAVNRLIEGDQIEIEVEGPQSPGDPRSPYLPYHTHSRGASESLLHSRSRGLSESQNLLSGASKNLFEYSSTRELAGSSFGAPGPPRSSVGDSPVWVGVPQTLRRYKKEWWSLLLLDILAFATGFPFLVLGGYLIKLDGKQVKDHQLYILEQCIKGVSTLLPLVFSLIVGRTMVKIASWKLEKGTSLGLMEQLMGSRTVGGTITMFIRLRSWKLLSIGLIVLWLLSPVGSQAALRMLSTTPAAAPLPQVLSLNYFNMRQPSYAGFTTFDSWFSSFASIFSAALFSPETVKASNLDLWNNVKIPFFSSLSNASQDVNGWKQVSPNSTHLYSSLFGVPITKLSVGETTFKIESSYMELSCANRTSNLARDNGTFIDPGLISPNGSFRTAQTVTSSTSWIMGYLGDDLTSLLPNSSTQSLDSLPSNTTSQTFFPALVLYQDFTGANNVTSIFCTPSQAYVESTVVCTKSSPSSSPSCAVTAQRLSLLPHMPTTITLFSFIKTWVGTSLQFPNSEPQINNIDPIQNYIVNPTSNSFIQSTTFASLSGGESRFLDISVKDFGTRLSQVMNSFLQGSMTNSSAFLTDPDSAFASLPRGAIANTPESLSAQINAGLPSLTIPANTTAPPTTPQPLLYRLSYPWFAFFLLASLMISLSALLSAILTRQTVARDYVGSVSSIARESQYVNFPPGGASLDGVQRSREMRGFRIKLGDQGDVEGGFSVGTGVSVDVGVLALGEERGTRGLDKRKLYL